MTNFQRWKIELPDMDMVPMEVNILMFYFMAFLTHISV